MPFREGDRFGRYIIGPLLGQGGMGEVRRAEDTLLTRPVALKILLRDESWGDGVLPSPEAVARLMREARAAAALDHPNAVAIFDVGEEGDHPYIAMELIAGVTMRTLIGDEAQPLDRRIRWSLEVARALAAAHRRGIVHRDVKPENVMVREDGVVKVLDFGIARSASRKGEAALTAPGPVLPTITAQGVSVGTPLYMAPEQLRGDPVDPRGDQFAWGVVVYELLTGVSPWAADGGPLQAVSNILTLDPERARTKNPRIPQAVDDVVRRALAKDPSHRFASMDDVVRALEPHAGVALDRRAATLPPLRVKKRRTRVITAALVLAVLGGGAVAVRLGTAHGPPATAIGSKATGGAAPSSSVTERGSALSANPEATAAYRAGMQALHDASLEAARERFRYAMKLDPTFAAPLLGLILSVWDVTDELRDVFRRAESLRAQLGERDRALLGAFEPWMRVPSDLHAVETRLGVIAAGTATDVEALVQLGKIRNLELDYEAALAPLDAALRLDPELPEALDVRGTAYAYLDRVEDALRDYHRCTELSPNATSCLRSVDKLQANEGRCAEAETTARTIIKAEPGGAQGYALLAGALYGQGQPIEAVRIALEGQVERSQRKAFAVPSVHFRVPLLEGRLDDALAAVSAWNESLRDEQDDALHFFVVRTMTSLLFELGRPKEAAAEARAYGKKRAGWTPDPSELDPSLRALAIRYRAGDLPRDAFLRARDPWRASEWKRLELDSQPRGRIYVWFGGYAESVKSPADAKEALAALPELGPMPPAIQRDLELDEELGATLLHAGRPRDAVAPLRRAAASCGGVEKPLVHLRALGELGDALQKTGDVAGACRAYATVLKGWGAARSTSITVGRARAGVHALRCPPAD